MLLIALTGGIGSGKSTAANFFRQCGAHVIEADELARDVLAVGSPGLTEVKAHFGEEVMETAGALNREALARIVFADPGKRAALEKIVHPLVELSFRERISSLPKDAVVIYEIPLLAEVGRSDEFQLVIAIETPLSMRIERMSKRGFTQEQAMARISGQATNEDRRSIADIVLTNSKDELSFSNSLAATWDLRLRPFAENLVANRPATPSLIPSDLLPNLLPMAKQIDRVVARVAGAVGGEVRVVSPTEFQIAGGSPDLWAKLNHLGFVEIEPNSVFASADPGRPFRVVVTEK
jgi:dephospho-CoA kinase